MTRIVLLVLCDSGTSLGGLWRSWGKAAIFKTAFASIRFFCFPIVLFADLMDFVIILNFHCFDLTFQNFSLLVEVWGGGRALTLWLPISCLLSDASHASSQMSPLRCLLLYQSLVPDASSHLPRPRLPKPRTKGLSPCHCFV